MTMPTWHLIEGEAGCRFAVEHHAVAIIVDALRASATAAMLLEHGATELIITREVEEARRAKTASPEALLYGERGGVPPEGFDYGNSPRETKAAQGRQVIFTTTTGAGRLVAAWGARAIYMGTTTNAAAVVQAAQSHNADVVLIPVGLSGDPEFDAQEDWVAACAIALRSQVAIGEGADRLAYWKPRIEREGLPALFESAPHAAKLRAIHMDADIAYCARLNLTSKVPKAIEKLKQGIRVLAHDTP